MNEEPISDTQPAEPVSTAAPAPAPAPAPVAAAPPIRRSIFRRLRYLPFSIIFAAVALYVLYDLEATPVPIARFVNAVEVTRPPSLSIDAGSLIGVGGEKDFYVVVKTKGGNETELATMENTLIGNGLTWPLSPPMTLSSIAELELRDSDIGTDDKLDRVTVDGNLITTGQKYQFELIEENPTAPPADLRIVWSLISGCTVLALVTAVLFIRDQAAD